MTVQRDAEGRRYVAVDIEVPGTVEEVWQAIATGPGISSWFLPAAIDGRVGGEIRMDFGPGMESRSTITAWDPPHRFAAENRDMGPEAPTQATEWMVETRSGDTCVVRVVHSWFAASDDWDSYFSEVEHGWPTFFRVLSLYLTSFRDEQGVATMQLVSTTAEPAAAAWTTLLEALGLSGAAVGARVETAAALPPLAGVVTWAGKPEWSEELLLRLDVPGPGIAHLFAMAMGDRVYNYLRVYLYGADATRHLGQLEPAWQGLLAQHFPMPEGAAAD